MTRAGRGSGGSSPDPHGPCGPAATGYLFQRFHDNHARQGAILHNVAVTSVGSGVRYRGIWTATGAPNAGAGSPIEARVAQEVSCAPGRAGATLTHVTAGEQVMVGANDSYGTSSTIKSANLYYDRLTEPHSGDCMQHDGCRGVLARDSRSSPSADSWTREASEHEPRHPTRRR